MGLEEILDNLDGIEVHVVHGDASDLLAALTGGQPKEADPFEQMYRRFRQVDKTARGTYSMLRSIGRDDLAETFGVWHKGLLKRAIDFMEANGVPDTALDSDKELRDKITDHVNGMLEHATNVLTEILNRQKAAMATVDITDLLTDEAPVESTS